MTFQLLTYVGYKAKTPGAWTKIEETSGCSEMNIRWTIYAVEHKTKAVQGHHGINQASKNNARSCLHNLL